MKNLEVYFIYILGVLITLIGVFLCYVSSNIYLEGDALYGVSKFANNYVILIFIIGGILVVLFELLISKDYQSLKANIINLANYLKQYRLTYLITIALLVFILSVLIDGIIGVAIVYLFVIASIIVVFVENKEVSYIILGVFMLFIFVDGTISYELVDRIWILFVIVLIGSLVYGLFLLGVFIHQKAQKSINKNYFRIIDYFMILILSIFFETGTYMSRQGATLGDWSVEKKQWFFVASISIIAYCVFMVSRSLSLHKKMYLN
jgi:hypothetical protein